MHLFTNSPTVDTLACKPTSSQLVAVSCGACERCTTPLLTGLLHRTVQRYIFLTSHSRALEFFVHLTIIERGNQLRVLLEIKGQSVDSLLFHIASAWQLQDVRSRSWETDLCSCNY